MELCKYNANIIESLSPSTRSEKSTSGLVVRSCTGVLPIDSFRRNVAEVHRLRGVIGIQSDDVNEILVHEAVPLGVGRHVPHVVFVREYNPRFDSVAALASVLVRGSLVPRLVAFAIESSRRVFALLTANLGSLDALVDIGARLPVVEELVPGVALAVITRRCVHASVTALIELGAETLVDVAVSRLVALVGTIRLLVAHQLLIYACPVCALEVVRIRARIVPRFARCKTENDI